MTTTNLRKCSRERAAYFVQRSYGARHSSRQEVADAAAGSEVLTDHIKVCEQHPMRKVEADISMLRAALVGLIGVDSEQELRQMEAAMRLLPAPEADKAVSINAIHALLATMPPNAPHEGPGGFSPGPLDAVVGPLED